ncbi:MAG: TIGR01777 family protein [Elusimicrobia bacterium]|nr:TIGR01777 family protein [Elusimicrobiota bacterium]
MQLRPWVILVSGTSGLVGSALVPALTVGGHRVIRLVRSQPKPGEEAIRWDPLVGMIDAAGLERAEAVVHLAGENIAGGRWTAAKKAKIRHSRVKGTWLLCEAIARLAQPPKVVLCASAIGYYGDRGEELLTEESAPGSGFLAEVCREWEKATEPAVQRGVRVVQLRFGMVLSPAGGALAKMLLPFRMGIGGVLGSGRQYMSWITLNDVVGVIQHALTTDTLKGPVNVVTPHPVTNREFTKTLGRVLGRPTLFPIPAFAARVVFGEMADELLLASTRVQPTRLVATGYRFRSPELEEALRHFFQSS